MSAVVDVETVSSAYREMSLVAEARSSAYRETSLVGLLVGTIRGFGRVIRKEY
ncbi:hypothetical protein [Actinoplanes sp. G11-F43]|uniref:hypothetical protein n=1 Tax=Actinoplanes sp. G11-F43 TaxID=3424130 RepID=UPI003D34A0E0